MTPDNSELLEFLYRSPIALVSARLDGQIQMMSPLACQWLMPLAQGGELDNLFSVLKDVAPALKSLVEQRTSNVICENMLLHVDAANARARYFSLTVHLFSDNSIAAVLADVSDEHRQIDHAQQGLRTLRNTLQTSPIAVGIARLVDQRLVFFNTAYSELVCPGAGATAALDICAIYKDPAWFENTKQRLLSEEFILNQLVELKTLPNQSQRTVWALASYMVIDYEGEKSILTWLYDVTDLQQAKQASEEASLAKGQFLATMSHEIRTPMHAILGMLKLFEGTALTDQQSEYIGKASGAAQSLLSLLDNVLDFSKVDAGKMELDCQPFKLETLWRDLSVVVSPSIKQKIEVLFDIDPQLPEYVVGDAHRLRQILINLGGNAVKFTQSGQVVISAKLVRRDQDSLAIAFAVEDSGIGIAPAQQQRIFTGFTQAEASTTRRFGGTGLGLAISKSLVELMGGVLYLDSRESVGSTFSFSIDFHLAQGDSVQLPRTVRAAVKHQRVLIVDDNPVALQLLSGMAQSLGWECACVSSGDQAADRLQPSQERNPDRTPFTLLLVNWQMPHMDGWELSRRVRTLCRQADVPAPMLIMHSDNGRQDLSQRTREEQALVDGFLVKPFTVSMLLDAVADAHSEKPSVRKLARGRASRRQLDGMRILVVEDNQINQQIAEELLASEGALVSLAANGELGVEAVRKAAPQFDAVLMDLQMPVMDGYAATSAIRNDLGLQHLPIVAMTANAMAADREACLAAGMNEHIGKPFDLAKLVSLLIRTTGLAPPSDNPDRHVVPVLETWEPVFDIEGVALRAALARMAGTRSLYVRTAKDFLKILATAQDTLSGHAKAKDWKKLAMGLHTLKGNADTLGLTVLAQEARRLEKLCALEDEHTHVYRHLEGLAHPVEHAKTLVGQAVAALQSGVFEPVAPAASTGDVARALASLAALETLLADEDMEALLKFAELREHLQTLPNGWCDQLEQALQDLDLQAGYAICVRARESLKT
jgi:signal transduction histidine kinase/CheY-like chemotaxis protein